MSFIFIYYLISLISSRAKAWFLELDDTEESAVEEDENEDIAGF